MDTMKLTIKLPDGETHSFKDLMTEYPEGALDKALGLKDGYMLSEREQTDHLIQMLRDAVDETERNLRNENAQYLRGDAAEVQRRATELAGRLVELDADPT